MAETYDWRDEFEDKDVKGNDVVHVSRTMSGRLEYAYIRKHDNQLFVSGMAEGYVTRKQKPKTYRPYTREDLQCGIVFRNKANGVDYMVVRIGCSYVTLGGDNDNATSFSELLDRFVQADGSPAGVLE